MADIFGTIDDDSLSGTANDDSIWGLEGNDTIDAGNGNDLIYGGPGADTVRGGGGDDVYALNVSYELTAGDSFDGGAGYDTLAIDVDVPNFDLASLSYVRVEALVATTSSYGLGVTAAQLNGFQSVQGYFRVLNSVAVTISGPTLVDGTTFQLGPNVTNFTFAAASGATIGVEGNAAANQLTGSDSNDLLSGAAGSDLLTGGAGNDWLVGGQDNDVLTGGAGHDLLQDGDGIDTLDGGDGNDSFLFLDGLDSNASAIGTGDTVAGGSGTDSLIFQVADTATLSLAGISGIERILSSGFGTLNLTAAQLTGIAELGGNLGLVGTGAVTLGPVSLLTGSIPLDAYAALGFALSLADPTIRLGDGVTSFDFTAATYARVFVWAGANGASIIAGNGLNTIYGGQGNDIVTGGIGDDTVVAGLGDDTVYGGTGYDQIYGNNGNDWLYGGSENDYLYGGLGLDRLYGGDGTDFLYCGDLAAVISESSVVAGEVYDGGAGFDSLILPGSLEAAAGPIDLSGATLAGIEALVGGSLLARIATTQLLGVQDINGRFQFADNGSVSLAGVSWQSLELQLHDGGQILSLAGGNAVVGLVTVIGGLGNDTITAGPTSAEIFGGDGNDILSENGTHQAGLYGDAGNDRLVTNGNAYIAGGSGFDTLVMNGSGSLPSLTGIEAIELTPGSSLTLTASQAMAGLAFNTALSGSGMVTIAMDAGVLLSITGFQGAAANPGISFTINGTSGVDAIKAAHFSNTISGGAGTDQIRGGNGVDTIDGGTERDKIAGWGGADILTGGGGNDQFRYLFATDSGIGALADRITDFTIGGDVIDLRLLDSDLGTAGVQGYTYSFIGAAAFTNGGGAQVRYANSGADLLVQLDLDGNGVADMEIVLQGLAGQTMTAGDFLFV